MDVQKEALQRIIATLANKNEELNYFLDGLSHALSELEANTGRVTSDLEAEFESLSSALLVAKETLSATVCRERERREKDIQCRVSESRAALQSSLELLRFANDVLEMNQPEEFSEAAKQIKERVTMAPAFRLATAISSISAATDVSMSHLTVDFSRERQMLCRLSFLPVPPAPVIEVSRCHVHDNAITVAWRMPDTQNCDDNEHGDGDHVDGENTPVGIAKVDHFFLEYRKTHHGAAAHFSDERPWERLAAAITGCEFTLKDLKFDTPFINVRVRAANRAACGEFSDPVTMETRAFDFSLDATCCHANLRVSGDVVTWEPVPTAATGMGGAGLPAPLGGVSRAQGRSATPSPKRTANSATSVVVAPAALSTATMRSLSGRTTRDRFTGESYTVLGDRAIEAGAHYWEVRPQAECKAYAVGVAYRHALGKFEPLGRGPGAWSLHASQWLQSSLAAKHNNRAKTLEAAGPLPVCVGVYLDHDAGELSFFNAENHQLIHTFRNKFTQPVVPAFMVWCGGFTVMTGLQVPSYIGNIIHHNPGSSKIEATSK